MKKKKKKKACMDLVQPTMKLDQLKEFSPNRKSSSPREAQLVMDILHDIF